MSKMDGIRNEELLHNGGPYLPICLVLDTSRSMLRQEGGTSRESGRELARLGPTRLALLTQGLEAFYRAIYSDEMARCTVELSIVTFDDEARKIMDFRRLEQMRWTANGTLVSCGMAQIPLLEACGTKTAMGEGVNLALDILNECKNDYRARGVDYYQPWMVLISDGCNSGDPAEFARAKARVAELVGEKRLAVYPLAIGSQARLSDLNALSPEQKAVRLETASIPSMFRWLAKSAETVSYSTPGNQPNPKLEDYEPVSWAKDLSQDPCAAKQR